jgi:thioredoxin 2
MSADSSNRKLPVVLSCPSCGTRNRIDLARHADRPKCARCGAAFALGHPHQVGDAAFQAVIEGASVPVLVDFYADWCGPCRAMAPVLQAFAADQMGRVLVVKLDTEANQRTAGRFGIQGIPTLIALRDGQEYRRHVGMADAQALARLVA